MLRFTEKQVTLNGSTSIVDFELDSFSNLQLEFTLSKPASIEVALGEVLAPDGRIHRTPGGYRTIRIMNKKCPKGKSCFPFELKMHQTPYPGKPTVSLPEEAQGEIIPFRYVEITGGREGDKATPVSYTHLTLPTKRIV